LIAIKARGMRLELQLRILTFAFAALIVAVVCFSKKSWPPYLMLSLFPICLLFKSKLHVVAFALFGVVCVVSPSYWATVFAQFTAVEFHQGLLSNDPKCFLFLFMQLLLISYYLWILQASIREIHQVPRLASGNLQQDMSDALGS
jgi:hypothetical protein